ncbi:MAG: vanadium-dependent haloperoxidase [Deltaproteobacteria bacterium]|nr:vanadium-dependent haloperoxidase [Deltaproteobacteria bacterium]
MTKTHRGRTWFLGYLMMVGMFVTPAAADVVTDWNANTLTVIGQNAAIRPTPSLMLDLTMVHIAMHDAIQAFQGRFETYNEPISNAAGSPVAAAAKAARDVLAHRFPAQAVATESTYQNYLSANGLLSTYAGVSIGQQAARNIINRRANDGSFPSNPEVFTGGTAPGEWRPTPPALAPMLTPWFGAVEPFVLKGSTGMLSEPPPPHLRSGAYAKAYNEVKALGARVNSTRTPEQTDLAYFYSDNIFAQLNRALRAIATEHLSDIGDSARLFALAHAAGTDALIVSWNKKRYYYFWRPSTAIVNGDDDGNPHTVGDPTWLPLINDPAYPDYTSGVNSITSAFMRTLERFFDTDDFTFTVTSNAAQVAQKTRTYSRFSDVAADTVEARILLGIHFRFADTVARKQGKQVADKAFEHILRPTR